MLNVYTEDSAMQPTASVLIQKLVSVIVLGASLLAVFPAHAADGKPAAVPTQKTAIKQKTYATPEAAAADLLAAAKTGDAKRLSGILGVGAGTLQSGDPVSDRRAREIFVASFESAKKFEKTNDGRIILTVGKDNWPLPFPLVKAGESWRFDGAAGKEELVNRRIGRNELNTIQAVLAYVDAQREYYLTNPQKDRLSHYASRFVSSKGKRDGLYFPTKSGEKPSPLGPLFDSARAAGYAKDGSGKLAPYHGYNYRILARQGAEAAGGTYNYLAQGRMIGGHALVAWPAVYGNSGVMTFIVNHDGVVYEKDLGPGTAAVTGKLTMFNPDSTWRKTGP
jgi:hypothetical protein